MTLFEIAQQQKMFSDRQAAAFRLYLRDPAVRETLLAHHQESLETLALRKPDSMGRRVAECCLDDRRYRFRRALDALADEHDVRPPFFPPHLMETLCPMA